MESNEYIYVKDVKGGYRVFFYFLIFTLGWGDMAKPLTSLTNRYRPRGSKAERVKGTFNTL